MRPLRQVFVAMIGLGLGCSSKSDTSNNDRSPHSLDGSAAHPGTARAIDDFRVSESAALRSFNDFLRRQRSNEIDELGLADAIDHNVLPQWRALRSRVVSATESDRDATLVVVLRRYLERRQQAWEAYVRALRSPNDDAAKPHYAIYHSLDAAAVEDARELGAAFRTM